MKQQLLTAPPVCTGAAQVPPPSLPSRFRPAVAGSQVNSQSSLSACSQEHSQKHPGGARGVTTINPLVLSEEFPPNSLEEEASSPEVEAAKQLLTTCEGTLSGLQRFGDHDLDRGAGRRLPAGDLYQSCGAQNSDSWQGGRSIDGGAEGLPPGGLARPWNQSDSDSWQGGKADENHTNVSFRDQLAASARFLREEQARLSQDGTSIACSSEGVGLAAPGFRHGDVAGREGVGSGMPVGSSVGEGEGVGFLRGCYDSAGEFSGALGGEEGCLGLRESPTVEEELAQLGGGRFRGEGNLGDSWGSPGRWGGSRRPAGRLEHPSPRLDCEGSGSDRGQPFGGDGMHEACDVASSPLANSRCARLFPLTRVSTIATWFFVRVRSPMPRECVTIYPQPLLHSTHKQEYFP
jgi:hypothetical protein